jgi:hypothetical protein
MGGRSWSRSLLWAIGLGMGRLKQSLKTSCDVRVGSPLGLLTTRITHMTSHDTDDTTADVRTFQPLAGILAWVVPGLGHYVLGQRVRGIRIFAGMALLIFGGLFIGGVDTVDSKNDNLWFMAQACAGPVVLGVDVINQKYVKELPAADQIAWRSLGHVNSVGTLFIALAGLLNVVVILDAFYPARRDERYARREGDPA